MVTEAVTRDSGYADLVRAYAVMLDDKKFASSRMVKLKSF